MSKFMKSVFHPIGNIFTRPKSVWGKSSNWIADIVSPAVLGMVPYVGPALAAGYGGTRGWQKMAQQNRALNQDRRDAGQPENKNNWWDYTKSIGGGVISGYAAGAAGKSVLSGAKSMLGSGASNAVNYGTTAAASAPAGLGVGSGTATGSALAQGGNIGSNFMTGASYGMSNYGMNKAMQNWWSGTPAVGAGDPANAGGQGTPAWDTGRSGDLVGNVAGRSGGVNIASGGGGGVQGSQLATGAAGVASLLNPGAGGAAGAATQGLSKGQLLAGGAGIASLMAKPPQTQIGTAQENLELARNSIMAKYLGNDAASQIPGVVAENYLDMISKPIGEMYPAEKDARWGRIEKTVNTSYDDYEKSIQQRYAQAGGLNSSDYKEEVRKAKQDRSKELGQAKAELEQSLFNTQITMKKDALLSSMQQNQFDEKMAYELAGVIQQEDQLRVAIANQDYDQFQQVMGLIMAMGTQGAMTRM